MPETDVVADGFSGSGAEGVAGGAGFRILRRLGGKGPGALYHGSWDHHNTG